MTLLTILGVTKILSSFRLVREGKAGKEMPESSRLEFLERFLANNFVLLDPEDNTSGPLMDSFVLVACASFTASRIFLQQLLACLKFPLDSEDLFC